MTDDLGTPVRVLLSTNCEVCATIFSSPNRHEAIRRIQLDAIARGQILACRPHLAALIANGSHIDSDVDDHGY